MDDLKQELLIKMVLKINEAGVYNIINIILTILWLTEIGLALFGYVKYDVYYWLMLVLFLFGNYHLVKKYDMAMLEYNELKERYENL